MTILLMAIGEYSIGGDQLLLMLLYYQLLVAILLMAIGEYSIVS